MARYIDADKMREEWLENGENEYVYDTNSVLDSIDEQPTADVVEVVRCEKCVWALEPIQEKTIGEELETYHFCKIHNKYFTPDNYCSCGERKVE